MRHRFLVLLAAPWILPISASPASAQVSTELKFGADNQIRGRVVSVIKRDTPQGYLSEMTVELVNNRASRDEL